MKNKKETKEDMMTDLKGKILNNIGKTELPPDPGVELLNATSDMVKGLSEEDRLNKKKKMKLPIGKLYSIGKIESKEAMSSGGSGQYSQPLFTETKKEMEEKWSKKYKDSIDCNNPKGFSQRAHCQGKKKKETNEEVLKGGVSDNKKLIDIAKKHDKKGYYDIDNMMETLKKELSKGIKVEMEHTNNRQRAKEIAMDHLYENPKYYSKLKKIETKEATSSSSVGAYDAPGFEDVQMRGNNPKGSGKTHKKTLLPGGKFVSENTKKDMDDMMEDEIYNLRDSEYLKLIDVIESVNKLTQVKTMVNFWELFQKKFDGYISKKLKEKIENKIKEKQKELNRGKEEVEENVKNRKQIPGGKFVQVKEKCKKFPYCNQGDIKALKIFENEKLKEVISKISKEKQISESLIKKILISKINKTIYKK
jgi:hypothetical protein